jgi:hypothetical protein
MAETQTLSPEQEKKLREITAKAGMDPNNQNDLEFAAQVVGAVLDQTQTPETLAEMAQRAQIDPTPYMQERPAGLKESLDILNKTPQAEPKLKELQDTLAEVEKVNKSGGFAAILYAVLTAAGAVGALLLTNNMLVKKENKNLEKKDNARYNIQSKLGRRATRTGATLAGAGIIAFISNKLLLAPKFKKQEALAEKIDSINLGLSDILQQALQEEVAIRAVAYTYQENVRAQQEQEQQQQKQLPEKGHDNKQQHDSHHKGEKAPAEDAPNPHDPIIKHEHKEVDADPDFKGNAPEIVKKPDEPAAGYMGKVPAPSDNYTEGRVLEKAAAGGERKLGG